MAERQPPTLDEAQQVMIAALEGRLTENRVGFGWFTIEDVEDGGADRHERVVTFVLALPGGKKTFAATIREEEEAWDDPSPWANGPQSTT